MSATFEAHKAHVFSKHRNQTGKTLGNYYLTKYYPSSTQWQGGHFPKFKIAKPFEGVYITPVSFSTVLRIFLQATFR